MMAGLQQKITRHATKQKNVTHNKEKKSIKINSETTQILELADKDVIMTLFQMFKSQRQRRYKKDTKHIIKTQVKLLEMKTTMSKLKNIIDGIYCRLHTVTFTLKTN